MSAMSQRSMSLLSTMSVEEKAGQLFIFTFTGIARARDEMRYMPGGFVRIFSDVLSVARESAELQKMSKIPLIISADFERGIGSTVSGAIDIGTMMLLGATRDEKCAYDAGQMIATEAAAIGVNMNYVPVLDVNVNEANPIINTRSFGEDPQMVARLGAAFIKGTKDGGLLSCGKHFPGHGDTSIDSHSDLGKIDADRQRFTEVELVPFKAAIDAGVDAIMSAHLVFPAYEPDNIPATLSSRILQGLLRDELGFEGAIISDALEMGGITKHFPPEVAIPAAINAGCDQLIMPVDSGRAVQILIEAVRRGDVTEARLDEAVLRVLTMKENGGVLDSAPPDVDSVPMRTFLPAHQKRAAEIAAAGTTLLWDSRNMLPLARGARITCVSVMNYYDTRGAFLEPKSFFAHLSLNGFEVSNIDQGLLPHGISYTALAERAAASAADTDYIILAAYVKVVISSGGVKLDDKIIDMANSLKHTGKPIILVCFGSPYAAAQLAWVDAAICCYCATEPAQQIAAEILTGKHPWQGKCPVTISGIPSS